MTTSTRRRPCGRNVLGGRADHEWAADAAHPRGRPGAPRRAGPGPRGGRPLRRRAAPDLAGAAAARPTTTWWCSTSRRTTWTSRRWTGWPGASVDAGRARRRHARPVVPRRGDDHHLGAARRDRRRVRRRVRGVRPGPRRAGPAGRRGGGPAPEPGPQGAGLAAPGAARPDVEAEVPDRRGERDHRGRAAAEGPAVPGAVRRGPARPGRRRRRGRHADPGGQDRPARRDLAPRPGRAGRRRRRQRGRQDQPAAADLRVRDAGQRDGADRPYRRPRRADAGPRRSRRLRSACWTRSRRSPGSAGPSPAR